MPAFSVYVSIWTGNESHMQLPGRPATIDCSTIHILQDSPVQTAGNGEHFESSENAWQSAIKCERFKPRFKPDKCFIQNAWEVKGGLQKLRENILLIWYLMGIKYHRKSPKIL